jgi:hypothetical protein
MTPNPTPEQKMANLLKAREANKGKPKTPTGHPRLTPIKAIRFKCLDCMCGSSREVELCTAQDCPLFEYRFGRRPTPQESAQVKSVKPLNGK